MAFSIHPRTWSIPVWIFILCVLISLGILGYGYLHPQRSLMDGLRACAQDTRTFSALNTCTRKVVKSQLENHSASELLNEVSLSPVPKRWDGDCHSIAHAIGQETYDKYQNLEQTLSYCSNQCFSGCLHGAFGEAFVQELGGDANDADIAHMDVKHIETVGGKYCKRFADMQLCHGMGHILYSLTQNFKAASQSCASMATGYLLSECVTGVYMQGIGGIVDSLALGKTVPSLASVPDGDYGYPCNVIPRGETINLHSCLKYLAPYQEILFRKNNIKDPAEKLRVATHECETLGMPERSFCFEGMGRFMAFYVPESATTTGSLFIKTCADLPTEPDRESCARGHARILKSYNQSGTALAYCTAIPSQDLQDSCFFSIFSYYGLDYAPSEKTMCSQAASKSLCSSELAKYAKELPVLRKSGNYGF
jgi:hypothetical protein